MKIYTKTGDDGTTSLFDGKRVKKDDLRVATYGDVDELNAMLGICISAMNETDLRDLLLAIQRDLFALGAQLANPAGKKQKSKSDFSSDKISLLEKAIDRFEEELAPMKNFILPGGHRSSAHLHFARTICRRAERFLVTLSGKKKLNPTFVIYLNRLSDLLFVLARVVNKRSGVSDIPWS